MIDNLASCVYATGSRAWVLTLAAYASSVLHAVCTNHALGLATRRSSDVIRLARTHGVSVNNAALAVRAAW